MNTTLSVIWLGVEVVMIVLTLLAILRLGFARLDSSAGIWRDGLSFGKVAPFWTLPDSRGFIHSTPTRDRWQFLIFTDHSLVSFPSLIVGMYKLARIVQDLEILILSRGDKEDCETIVKKLDLQIPVVSVDQAFYYRYRVRVMPFATLLDPNGIIHWKGLINTEDQLFFVWQMVQATANGSNLSLKEVG